MSAFDTSVDVTDTRARAPVNLNLVGPHGFGPADAQARGPRGERRHDGQVRGAVRAHTGNEHRDTRNDRGATDDEPRDGERRIELTGSLLFRGERHALIVEPRQVVALRFCESGENAADDQQRHAAGADTPASDSQRTPRADLHVRS